MLETAQNHRGTIEDSAAAALLARANALCTEHRHDDAVPVLQEALARDTENAHAWRQLAQVLSHLERREDAIGAYQGVLQLVPRDAEALISIAVHQSFLRRFDEALQSLDQLLETEPRHLQALLTKGQILAHIGSLSAARDVFRAAISIDPRHEVALRSCANVASDVRMRVDIYRKLVELDGSSLEDWKSLGQGLLDARAAADPRVHGEVNRRPDVATPMPAAVDVLLREPRAAKRTKVALRRRIEALAELVALQHRRLGFLDSFLTAARYGQTMFYMRTLALYAEKFGRESEYPPPRPEPPSELVDAFTMSGRISLETAYFNGRYPEKFVDTITDEDIDGHARVLDTHARRTRRWFDRIRPASSSAPSRHDPAEDWSLMERRAYAPQDSHLDGPLIADLRAHSVRGRRILVYEARGAFYESLCAWLGAKPTALRARKVVSRSARLRTQTIDEWESSRNRYEFAGSPERDGRPDFVSVDGSTRGDA